MAFDRKAFIDKFSNGRGMPAIGVIPPGFPTFDAHRVNPYTQYDVQAARKLMLDAVKVNGGPIPPLKILFREANTLNRQMAAFYTDAMAQIGVTLDPEYRDFARYLQMIDARQFQIFDGGWDADYPDEQDFLQLFYGPSAAPGGLNSIAYQNAAFDKLYEKSITMQDTPERRALYLQMQKMLEEDCPWLLTDYPIAFTLYYNWIGNRYTMDYGHGFMQYTTLDSKERAKRIARMH
jgi:ABC-type transport system substrate-binding protein